MTAIEARDVLACETPRSWLDRAVGERALLMIDHANCEKKAAGTALSLLYRYVSHADLLPRLSRLAREELRHFEQVIALMSRAGVEYVYLAPARYASALRREIRTHEPARLLDTLLVAALVEARSCERFQKLATRFDDDLGRFYDKLLVSEARHARDYLVLAQRYDDGSLPARMAHMREVERALIESPDPDFRFHSGVPAG